MMKERTSGPVSLAAILRLALWAVVLGAMLLAYGCGSESQQAGNAAKYPTGISEDIEQQLKYDARVDSFDLGDADLTVNVNEAWLNSPPGMQERSVGQWYSLWHSNHSGKVIVQHDGNTIATWTSENGYKPETKSKGDESHSES